MASDIVQRASNAERSLVGAAVIDPTVRDRTLSQPEHFGDLRWRALWTAIGELRELGRAIDETTLLDWLAQHAPNVGPSEVAEAVIAVPTAGNADYYDALVREHALERAVFAAAGEIVAKCREGTGDGSERLSEALSAFQCMEPAQPDRGMNLAELIKQRFREYDAMEKRRASGDHVGSLPTGLDDLDDLGGLRDDCVTIIGGRPGMGKSAMAQLLVEACLAAGEPVHYFGIEDGPRSLVDRMMARNAMGNIPALRIRQGKLDGPQMGELARTAAWITRDWGKLLRFEPLPHATGPAIVACARRHLKRHGTKVVVIENLQNTAWRNPRQDRIEGWADNMLHFQRAARDDQVAYVVLSQLLRDVERRPDKRPAMIADIYGGDAVGQYAKAIWFVHRPGRHDDKEPENLMEIICAKNNEGPEMWTVRAGWHGPTTRVYPWRDK